MLTPLIFQIILLQSETLQNVKNYPNPFNSSTTITWQSMESGLTKLEITDVFGRKVKSLVNDFKQKGEHEVHFESGELSSGIYIFQLKLGNSIVTKKMLIEK